MRASFLAVFLLAPGALCAQDAGDAGAGDIEVDLNKVEQVDASCRLSFTVQNGLGDAIESLVYETVLFDPGGAVLTLNLFDFGEVPAGGLRVRQFALADTVCDQVDAVLLNGVAACQVGGAEAEVCAGATELTSRAGIEVLR